MAKKQTKLEMEVAVEAKKNLLSEREITAEDERISLSEMVIMMAKFFEEDKVARLFDEFAFQGFNPIDFLNILNDLAKRKNYSQEKMIKDISVAIIWIIRRGVRFLENGRNTQEGKERMKTICSDWEIKLNTFGIPGNKDITLGRIGSTFPHLVTNYIYLYGEKLPVVGELPSDLPRFLAHPGAISIIPKSWNNYRLLWLEWSLSFDSTVNNGTKGKNSQTPRYADPQKVYQFFNSLSDSPLFKEADRVKIMGLVGLNSDINKKGKNASTLIKERAELNVALGRQKRVATTVEE